MLARAGSIAQAHGADEWEQRQERHVSLEPRQTLKSIMSAVEPLDEEQSWETNLGECWDEKERDLRKSKATTMQVRLEMQLRSNPLDYEKKPFSEKTQTVSQ